MSEPEMGLRELKKRMTRDAIANITLELALTKGLARVTIDEIAHAALVSPRTFSNYYSCKEEAAAAAHSPDLSPVLTSFGQRPVAEPPLIALAQILADFVRSLPPEQVLLLRRKLELAQNNPGLQPYLDRQNSSFEHDLRQSVALRLGMDADVDMYPSLVASAAASGLRSAVQLWISSEADAADLPLLIEEAFRQLSTGLAGPST